MLVGCTSACPPLAMFPQKPLHKLLQQACAEANWDLLQKLLKKHLQKLLHGKSAAEVCAGAMCTSAEASALPR
eukprot:gene12158-biopygen2398